MFYVYYGYTSPDSYDTSEGPVYCIEEFATEEAVLEFKTEFENELCDECTNEIFRVFSGEEKFIEPKEIVQSYQFK